VFAGQAWYLKTCTMQIDFHYFTIRIICEKAGFTPSESQIIAHASQYVDDATEHSKFRVKGKLDIDYPRYDGKYFDPVCTAHKGIQFLKAFQHKIQQKIYIAFHFIPDLGYNGKGQFNYITRPGGIFARQLVKRALQSIHNSKDEKRIKNLIKLGIALHSYADTWAHQNFSGRHNANDNDICQIQIKKGMAWKELPFFRKLGYNLFPDIGHAEALNYPDYSNLTWKYRHKSTQQEFLRENPKIFKHAAANIFALLGGDNSLKTWQQVQKKLEHCFILPTFSVDLKAENYMKMFPEISFSYNEDDWLKEALEGNRHELKSSQKRINFQQYKFMGDKKWFYFHLEAMNQREFILQNLPA
jgi:uncharacterized protein YneF (UPF0154 family)